MPDIAMQHKLFTIKIDYIFSLSHSLDTSNKVNKTKRLLVIPVLNLTNKYFVFSLDPPITNTNTSISVLTFQMLADT